MAAKSEGAVNQTLQDYFSRVRAFRPNARLYLTYVMVLGAGMGVFRLLFNFYVLSLDFDESLLGRLITTNNLTALLVALPIGYLADRLGRKKSLVSSGLLLSAAIVVMALWPSVGVFYAMNVLLGLAQSLSSVTTAPFLMENSGETERTYLFSFAFGLQMLSSFVGNWLGGYLPTWIGNWWDVSAVSSAAYAWSLGVVAVVTLLGLSPLLALKRQRLAGDEERSLFAPLSYFRTHRLLLGKLILPIFVTSIGAGMIMPFMNVFYRVVHDKPDKVIGSLFAWGSLAMGVGLLLAPALADRFGKMRVVVLTQAFSIPFLMALGFAPWFWVSAGAYYVRLALMNMSNPVYQTFVMEHVDAEARATVASLVSMAWNFGWAFSPTVSGYLQVEYGFAPPFLMTICLYVVAVFLYWRFFWHKQPQAESVLAEAGRG